MMPQMDLYQLRLMVMAIATQSQLDYLPMVMISSTKNVEYWIHFK